MLEESVINLSQALKSSYEPLKITSLLDCLAIITFVGQDNVEETERSMQVMWQFIDPKSSSHVAASEPHSQVLSAAICAWSYLLATMDSWNIDSKLWREAMSIFLNLLHSDDLSLRMAAGEALALIFEIGSLEKFYNETMISNGTSSHEENERYSTILELKETILNQVKGIAMETEGIQSAEKGLIKSYRTLFHEVLRVFKGGYSPDTKIKIGEDFLKLSTWSQLVQVNYLKRFLGVGFVKHAQQNELLHDFLEFTPNRNRQRLGAKLYIPSDEKVAVRYIYQPEIRKTDVRLEKMLKSPNSVLNKAKTQLMNNRRTLSQARNDGYYAVSLADED
ncbi:hypothetical protein AQUCO_04200180v1 [Aquilegia coerulea]|uniref:Interferon-related developmental regulator N-terminal domain-containing protein n=1 Tax=Aquilegia coerulea TaxID=218851 RepID=A0A2G5CPK3_AQUCA|nr:hypothetical protein AQUCO_04200180v1 [Aquilegia coerulea]